ncbi:MAG: hypothetical protein IJH82_00525 [Lachnospiraceae bacterium]|nr:hypothetical protein [Lachnospiraceae bacterium]
MHFETACIWDKCCEEKNSNVVAVESVMSDDGPVLLAVLAKDGFLARKTVGWFYEEGLRILAENGGKKKLVRSFMRMTGVDFHTKDFLIYIQKRNDYLIMKSDGFDDIRISGKEGRNAVKEKGCSMKSNCCPMKTNSHFEKMYEKVYKKTDQNALFIKSGRLKRCDAFLICTNEFKDAITEENLKMLLGRQSKENGSIILKKLDEMKRRAKSRGVGQSICAVYIRRKAWNTL